MPRFREFIQRQSFDCSLREDEAAPAMGSGATPPSDPNDTTNKHVPQFLSRQFNMRDEEFMAALETDSVTLYGTKIPDFGWPFRVNMPMHVSIENRGDESFMVTFPLEEMHRNNPNAFIHRYSSDENPLYWDGPVKDETEHMNMEQLMDAWVEPFAGGMAGGMGMGGMDPMGGGMGGPPMGGM